MENTYFNKLTQYLVGQKLAKTSFHNLQTLRIQFESVVRYKTSGICCCQQINQTRIHSFTANVSLDRALVRAMVVAALCFLKEGRRSQGCTGVNFSFGFRQKLRQQTIHKPFCLSPRICRPSYSPKKSAGLVEAALVWLSKEVSRRKNPTVRAHSEYFLTLVDHVIYSVAVTQK